MPDIPGGEAPQMTPGQLVALLDAAMRSRESVSYLDALRARFEMMARSADAAVTTEIAALLAKGELEKLLTLRAEWRRAQE